MRLSLFLSLSAALVMASGDPARADDWAFEWLEVEPPSGYTLATVHDVNNLGHILCRVKKTSDNHYYGAVFRDAAWHILDISPSGTDDIWVTDINNEGTVVGYSGVNANLMGRGWSWNGQTGTYDGGADLGAKLEVWSINDFGEMAGFDVDNSQVVGWLGEWSGWTPLNPLQGGDSTAARGLNHDGPPATVVGLATEKIGQAPTVTWAVAWIGSVNPTKIDSGQTDQTQTPHIINDNNWIVGSRVSGSSYAYLLWRPDGQGGWGSAASLGTITGSAAKAVGLNNSNEVVAKKTLFYEDGQGALQSVLLTDIAGIPLGTGVGQYNSTNMAFYAINDDGWIVGKAGRYIDSQTQVQTVLLLVPFDRNNDETPDYREIIADPTLDDDATVGGDWVLDWATQMRVGLHAPTTDLVSPQIDNVQVVRKMRDHGEIYDAMFDNQQSCENSALEATAWGHNVYNSNPYSDQPKEIIATIRTPLPETNDNRDYVLFESAPQGHLSRAQAEAALECFAHRFARCIDYVQVGNEIWSGSGRYYIIEGQLTQDPEYQGFLSNVPTDSFEEALELMFDQLSWQVAALRRGSALAGRPLQIIGPTTVARTTLIGKDGDVEGPFNIPEGLDGDLVANRCARFIQRLIEFCNDHDIPVDCHYIVWSEDDFLDASEAIAEQGNVAWPIPEKLVSLELAAVPSANQNEEDHWWYKEVESGQEELANSDWTSRFFDDDEDHNLQEGIETWTDWQEYWLDPESTHRDTVYDLPANWPLDGFIELASRGYRIACFPCRQNTGTATVATTLDMTAIYADKLKQENSPDFVNRWRDAFEAAASYFQISPWNPHPYACPTTPCPPCSE